MSNLHVPTMPVGHAEKIGTIKFRKPQDRVLELELKHTNMLGFYGGQDS